MGRRECAGEGSGCALGGRYFGSGTNLYWECGEQIRLLVHLHAVSGIVPQAVPAVR